MSDKEYLSIKKYKPENSLYRTNSYSTEKEWDNVENKYSGKDIKYFK